MDVIQRVWRVLLQIQHYNNPHPLWLVSCVPHQELEMTEQNLLFDVQNFRGQKGASKRVLEGLAKASDLMDRLVVCQWKKKVRWTVLHCHGKVVSVMTMSSREVDTWTNMSSLATQDIIKIATSSAASDYKFVDDHSKWQNRQQYRLSLIVEIQWRHITVMTS